jgi:poly(3-hydroxybutyrate) depolymerase
MKRSFGMSGVLTILLVSSTAFSPVHAQTPAELTQTAAYVAARQNKDGGFATKVDQPSSLAATNSALKILKHVGGSVPDILGCIKYVKSCHDAGGGFAQTPGGKPDIVTTAVGLIAASELKIAEPIMIRQASAYLGKNAKTFEEVRMAIAGLEAVNTSSPDFPRWNDQIQALRNQDGTFGAGHGQPFATGGAVAAILRMGLKLDQRDAVIAALKGSQRLDGAWSRDGGPSDLGSTYRIMRALYMLGEKPDVDRLLAFVARCRRSDGSYATTPDGAGDLVGTYLATIVIRWVRLLTGLPPIVETAGFTPLLNGKDLTGWQGNPHLWSVRGGILIGRSPGLDHKEFLATTCGYGEFSLRLNFRLVDAKGSSGVLFCSLRQPTGELSGFRAGIGDGHWGTLYDESHGHKVLMAAQPEALQALHKTDWNQYQIVALSDRILLRLNDETAVDYRKPGLDIRQAPLAVQLSAGGPTEIQFADLWIQRMPLPSPDNFNQPGFHLRTLKSSTGERKYTVYVPEGYDGRKTYPVILFLHGGASTGRDGIRPVRSGLGSAIFNRPGGIQALAVFPQAQQTWAAGSDDSKASLEALDDVLTHYKSDPKRVILTGLSMGGAGSWELAAAQPERFAAVVPIASEGNRPQQAHRLKAIPIWSFCGGDDAPDRVLNMRAMVEAVLREGGTVRITEFSGVGHRSWDRVYNDDQVINWMLAQHKP